MDAGGRDGRSALRPARLLPPALGTPRPCPLRAPRRPPGRSRPLRAERARRRGSHRCASKSRSGPGAALRSMPRSARSAPRAARRHLPPPARTARGALGRARPSRQAPRRRPALSRGCGTASAACSARTGGVGGRRLPARPAPPGGPEPTATTAPKGTTATPAPAVTSAPTAPGAPRGTALWRHWRGGCALRRARRAGAGRCAWPSPPPARRRRRPLRLPPPLPPGAGCWPRLWAPGRRRWCCCGPGKAAVPRCAPPCPSRPPRRPARPAPHSTSSPTSWRRRRPPWSTWRSWAGTSGPPQPGGRPAPSASPGPPARLCGRRCARGFQQPGGAAALPLSLHYGRPECHPRGHSGARLGALRL